MQPSGIRKIVFTHAVDSITIYTNEYSNERAIA